MNEPLSDSSWFEIYEGVKQDIANRRKGSPRTVKMIRLSDLVQHEGLPVCQDLKCLIDVDEAGLDMKDRIFIFISHRWHSQTIPDDGILISTIFQFCLNLVIKNNFPHLTPVREIHQSKSLSDRLTSLLIHINPNEVIQDQIHFYRFEGVFTSLTTNKLEIQLIKYLLSRFYVWIDFCCLPQVYYKHGVLVQRSQVEEEQFLSGLDSMDTLLQKTECVMLWRASEITRAWLFYESIMSVPQGTCSFMIPMKQIAAFSTIVRQFHSMFSNLGLLNSLYLVETFKRIGITATSHRDIRKIIFLMAENIKLTEWKFRVIV